MIRFGRRLLPDTLAEIVEPARPLLLVWDMQPDILNAVTDPTGVTANTAAVRDAARRAGVAISYSQQTAVPLEHETAVWIRARMRQAGVVRDAVASRQADAHERSLAFLQRTVDVTTTAELIRIWSA